MADFAIAVWDKQRLCRSVFSGLVEYGA